MDVISSLSDEELKRLGIGTIGLRHRLKQLLEKPSTSTSVVSQLSEHAERSRLFSPYSRSLSNYTKKTGKRQLKKDKFITLNFLCLSHTGQKIIPNSNEKEILNKAGLGRKNSFEKVK
jgi:hypothetical protein